MAEQEREAISSRTKTALAAAKARGQQLGAYRDGVFVGARGTALTAAKARAGKMLLADERASNIRFLVEGIDPIGTLTLKSLADGLNSQGVPTPSGRGSWLPSTARRLRIRLEGL